MTRTASVLVDFLIATSLAGAAGFASAGPERLIFPHFVDGGGVATHISLSNAGDSAVKGSLLYRDRDGQPLSVPGLGEKTDFEIVPNETVAISSTGESDPLLIGYAELVADDDESLTAVAILQYSNGREASVHPVVPRTRFAFFAERHGLLETALALFRDRPAPVSARLYDQAGTLVQTAQIEGSEMQLSRFLWEIFDDMPRPFLGYAELECNCLMAPIGLRFSGESLATIPMTALNDPPLMDVSAFNMTHETECAEEDNVNIPISAEVRSFAIEVSHPSYPIGEDNCMADFSGCSISPPDSDFPFPQLTEEDCQSVGGSYMRDDGAGESRCTIFDDGTTVVVAVRKDSWWREIGMRVSVRGSQELKDIHSLRFHRRVEGTSDFPQFMVLYMDGNLRLKPQPQAETADNCFGSSVLLGAAQPGERPLAEISSAVFDAEMDSLELSYRTGGSAIVRIERVDRAVSRLRVDLNYAADLLPFATFRSMWVEDGNSDSALVQWTDRFGVLHDQPVFRDDRFDEGRSVEWFFHRVVRSRHNTSAPDIRIVRIE